MTYLLSYLLATVGLTVFIVWPEQGLGAWLRDSVIRKAFPKKLHGELDCYICFGTWAGLILSPIWWLLCGESWCWFGFLMAPGLFWILLPFQSSVED